MIRKSKCKVKNTFLCFSPFKCMSNLITDYSFDEHMTSNLLSKCFTVSYPHLNMRLHHFNGYPIHRQKDKFPLDTIQLLIL